MKSFYTASKISWPLNNVFILLYKSFKKTKLLVTVVLALVQWNTVDIGYIVVKETDMSVFLTEEYKVMVKSSVLIGITVYLTL
jgi:hypothetical protein